MKTDSDIGVLRPQAKETWSHQGLEEARYCPPLEPSEGAQPCPPFDFRLLASRSAREPISVV